MNAEPPANHVSRVSSEQLCAQLAALPRSDLDARRAAEIAVRAREAFRLAHGRTRRSPRERLGEFYVRVLEPAWVAAFCLAYLGWAVAEVLALHG